MKLIEAVWSGLVMSSSALASQRSIDAVLTAPGWILVGFTGWWDHDLGPDGYAVLEGELVQDWDTSNWTLKRKDSVLVCFSEPEEDWLEAMLINNRLAQRLSPESWQQYVSKVRHLVSGSQFESALEEWIVFATPKSGEDPIAEFVAERTSRRDIGLVMMSDQDGVVVDALAIDDFGSAATARGNSWLASIGSQWSAYSDEDRPTIVEFMAWAGAHVPVGEETLGVPVETMGEGTLEAIALRYVPTTL